MSKILKGEGTPVELNEIELDDLRKLNPPDDPRMFRRFIDTIDARTQERDEARAASEEAAIKRCRQLLCDGCRNECPVKCVPDVQLEERHGHEIGNLSHSCHAELLWTIAPGALAREKQDSFANGLHVE